MSLAGRSILISLRPEEVPAVAEALARYRAARDTLEEEATAGVAQLRAARTRRR